MSSGIEFGPSATSVDFRELADTLDSVIVRLNRLERRLAPSWSAEFTQCGVCGVFSTDGICPRADCPRGQVIYPPPDHEAS